MSIEISNAVWRESKSTGRARLVLLAIADHQGEIGAWPSIETIAKMVNSSERSVQRDIQELVALGELEVHVQKAPSRGQYKSNLYWVILPSLSGVTKTRSGVTDLDSGVTESPSGVTALGALTLIEPLQKPNISNKQKTLDETWLPDDRLIGMFVTKWPLLNMSEQTEAFKLHHMAKGSKMVDWGLAYQNWMNRAQGWAAEKQPAQTSRKIVGDF
jgi:hypothetical protein